MKKRFDNFWLGLVFCLLSPLLLFLCTWQAVSGSTYADVVNWLRQPVFLQYIIMANLLNMLLLFWAYHTERWNVCRGGVLGFVPYLMFMFYMFF